VAPAEGLTGGSVPTTPFAAGPLWGPPGPSVRAGVYSHRRPLRNKALRNLASMFVPFNSNLSTIYNHSLYVIYLRNLASIAFWGFVMVVYDCSVPQ
jgi:hypothetical protein